MSNILALSRRVVVAAAVACALASAGGAALADCAPKDSRCGKDWAFCPDLPFLAVIAGDGCATLDPSCPKPAYCPADPKKSCGEHWTDWRFIGEETDNPCPAGCVPTERVGHDSRTINAFFQMQYRERWACGGAPAPKGKRTLGLK